MSGEDVSDTLHRLATGLLKHVQVRLKLLQEEVVDERDRIGMLLWHGVLCVFLAFFTLQMVVVVLMASVWDTPWRVHAAAGITIVVAIGTALAISAWKKEKRTASTLFAASLAEIAKDRAALEKL